MLHLTPIEKLPKKELLGEEGRVVRDHGMERAISGSSFHFKKQNITQFWGETAAILYRTDLRLYKEQ